MKYMLRAKTFEVLVGVERALRNSIRVVYTRTHDSNEGFRTQAAWAVPETST